MFFFFKQKTAYEIKECDWSSDVCSSDLIDGIWKFVILAGIIAFAIEFIVYVIGVNNSFSVEKTRTIVLTTAILYELFFVYTCRSDKSLLDVGIFSNKWMNYAILISILLHLLLIYSPLGALFGVIPLSLTDWLLVLPFALFGLFVFEAGKYVKRKKSK